ncbi:MAG: SCP2 sterol-binding domain-containing protein [Betaproteobacteria bacterium]
MMHTSATFLHRPRPLSRPLGRLLSHLPHPGSAMFAAVLNVSLRRDLPADVYQQLIGRRVDIAVSDWGLHFRVGITPSRFAPLPHCSTTDLSITATARDFGLLASGDEDPDTLYFERRVIVEGDTELALLIKNTLDALPAPKVRGLLRVLHRGMGRLRSFRAARGVSAHASRT